MNHVPVKGGQRGLKAKELNLGPELRPMTGKAVRHRRVYLKLLRGKGNSNPFCRLKSSRSTRSRVTFPTAHHFLASLSFATSASPIPGTREVIRSSGLGSSLLLLSTFLPILPRTARLLTGLLKRNYSHILGGLALVIGQLRSVSLLTRCGITEAIQFLWCDVDFMTRRIHVAKFHQFINKGRKQCKGYPGGSSEVFLTLRRHRNSHLGFLLRIMCEKDRACLLPCAGFAERVLVSFLRESHA